MQKHTSKKGFTLVEIMIVVVIIGLLAAMAIPAFSKVRTDSRTSAVVNDARQIASAAQQYMLEQNVTQVTFGYTAATGVVAAPLDDYVRTIGKGYNTVPSTLTIEGTFNLGHPQLTSALTFTAEGQKQ